MARSPPRSPCRSAGRRETPTAPSSLGRGRGSGCCWRRLARPARWNPRWRRRPRVPPASPSPGSISPTAGHWSGLKDRPRPACLPRSAGLTCRTTSRRTVPRSGPPSPRLPPMSSATTGTAPPPTCCTASDPPGSTCSAPCSGQAPSSASRSAVSNPQEYRSPDMAFPSDLEIARRAQLKPVDDIAGEMGLGVHLLEPYGEQVVKIKLAAIAELADAPKAKYVVVTAITPTPLGEGKTTTTVGLGQAFRHIGKRATVAIRQPSMGPTFGIKGGAAGGGYSQVVPMEALNLHLTGDMHAVTAANNMLAAMLDNHLFQGNALGLDLNEITWRRVMDVNDRSLRNIVIGLGPKADGVTRQTGFDITAAAEVMATLALSSSLADLRQRLGRIVVGCTAAGSPVTAEELDTAGSMAVILREAIKPNLLQTMENTP